ncbi:MAG: pilus assembly protein TadG-related protein [Burkholderiaceae bacterium]
MGSTTNSRRRRAQSGQALVLALLLIVGGAFLLLAVFSSGRVLATRQSLNDAADAAALSAATWRARVLNYAAYTNRAMVAQEVALAQAVTIASWARYFDALAANAESVAAAYPPAALALAAIASGADVARAATEQAASAELEWRAHEQLGYKVWLERSQAALLRSAQVFGLGAIANEVVRSGDPRFFAFALGDAGAFAAFAQPQVGAEDKARFREVVLQSLDPFTASPRSADHRLPLPSSCVGRSADLDKWTLWLRRRGGTALHESLETWSAVDTLSLHDWRAGGFLGLGACRDREAAAAGWGSAGAAPAWNDPQLQSAYTNPGATALALFGASSDTASLAGLPKVHDLGAQIRLGEAPAVSQLAVLARIEVRDIGTADALAVTKGRMQLSDGDHGRYLWALSAAEVYFSPPPEVSTPAQLPSLFSPFWQARLISPTEAHRAAAATYAR